MVCFDHQSSVRSNIPTYFIWWRCPYGTFIGGKIVNLENEIKNDRLKIIFFHLVLVIQFGIFLIEPRRNENEIIGK